MEILSFGIELAPQDKKSPGLRGRPSDQSPAAHLPRHDREHFSTIVNTAPRTAPKCSRSRGAPFTLPWNPCSPSRGNPVHDRVEYAIRALLQRGVSCAALVRSYLANYGTMMDAC